MDEFHATASKFQKTVDEFHATAGKFQKTVDEFQETVAFQDATLGNHRANG
ncbi:MAG: hypothetical protein LBT76_06435 [Tannerella sp.]|nr:hypothetical protein [Tannerella sp.]